MHEMFGSQALLEVFPRPVSHSQGRRIKKGKEEEKGAKREGRGGRKGRKEKDLREGEKLSKVGACELYVSELNQH